jgi:PAS domain S-box-containing protein
MELSGQLARDIFDAAPDPIVIVTADGTIAFASAQITQVFGYAPAEVLGREVECLLPERLRRKHPAHRRRFFTQPVVRPMGAGLELYGLHKDGHEFPVEISLSPIQTDQGLLVISAIRDVTTQRDAERALAEANRAKSRFLAAASHDLRQPLQALNLLNGVAERNTQEGSLLRTIVERQQRALDSMSGLLNSLLDISKLDAGMVAPEIKHFAVDGVFARLRSDFEEQAREKGIELAIEDCALGAYTDPELLQQLLMNLIANAVRYTHLGHVTVTCRRQDANLVFEVGDTGLGIPREEMDRIFEEFYQVDRGTRRPEGLGLGLSIVKRLMTLLGYELDVESHPGEGSVFRVTVPAGEVPAAIIAQPEPSVAAAGKRVLIIDDELAVAHATSLLLSVEGFDVDIASSQLEAIATAATHAPDLIISDYHLRGGETGAAVVSAVRDALHAEVPVVFVTGDTARAIADHGLKNAQLLTKPLRGEELLKTIRRQLAVAATARHDSPGAHHAASA